MHNLLIALVWPNHPILIMCLDVYTVNKVFLSNIV